MQREGRLILALCLGLAPPGLMAETAYPALQDADLVFQSSQSGQSAAVLAATGHPFTHMGMIRILGDRVLVIEAAGKVTETPFLDWVARGEGGRVAIYRHSGLDPATAGAIVRNALGYEGQPYDIFFAFDNDAIYCSELPYLAFDAAGVPLGTVERLSDLKIEAESVQALIAARWQSDPICAAEGLDFAACHGLLMERRLITPAAIARDPQLTRLYSDFAE
ncbi:MAG: peptidoglycan peptidase [Tabrizicola sp.]|nr:peptidoglycan peptidase [Tabrizicola sp.]